MVARTHQEPGIVLTTDFTGAVAIICHDRFAGGEGLGQGAREAFAQGQVNERVHDADISGNVVGWDEAGKDEMLLKPDGPGALLEPAPPFAVADQDKFYPGMPANQIWRDIEQIVVPFQLEQARDFADDEIAG